jgi:diacylglycerol kinase (ATP)
MDIIATKIHFLLFINTKSGNAHGKTFFTLRSEQLTIRYEDFTTAHLHLIDLFDPSSKSQGLELVKNFLANSTDFRVIVCGGDGTIPWVLSELLGQGLNLTQIIFGIIPIGTGNDFSRSIGWGSDTVKVSRLNSGPLSRLVK